MSGRRQLFNLNLSRESIECNIAIIGELGVGKSAITVKYLTKRFIMEYDPLLEDTYQKNESIDGQDVVVRVMDTSDSVREDAQKAKKSPERYLKWAQGIVVLYSITNRYSFDIARKRLEELNQYEKDFNKSFAVIIVGNKLDLERYRTVTKAEAQELANQYECLFHEVSAADDFHSVELLFQTLVRKITRPNEGPISSLQPLFITEDKGSLWSQGLGGRTFRRTKSPSSSDVNRVQEKDQYQQRRTPSTFKIFKSRFNIFN